MKKKLFVFVVLAMVLVACNPAVKGGDTSNSETPLELTAANLAGKWVLESDSTKWYEFKTDGTYSAYIGTTSADSVYRFEIVIDNKVSLYKLRTSDNRKFTGDTLKIELYRNRCLINSKKYNRQ